MGQQVSRPAFDSFLTKTHVQHALIQPDGRHNDIPTALATLAFLDRTPDQLQAIYDGESAGLGTWTPSPRSITDEEYRARFLGDVRFQRAYMTYFSMEHSKLAGNSRALLLSHLLTGAKPLICGLFAGLGRPLVFLSDALELHNPILVVQSLTLAAVDWMEPIFDILSHPGLQVTVADPLSPEQILGRVAYDGRLSGVMKAGPGFHGVAQIFANPAAKAAVLEYIQHLDCRDAPKLLSQLSALSPVILCATHKAATPAYDFYLSCIPTWVNSLRVLLLHVEEDDQRVKLIRGVWLLIVLAYITQLRPVLDASLLSTHELPKFGSWDVLWAELREQETSTGRCRDLQLLRTLRSMQELGGCYDVGMKLNLQAAWKLLRTWERWTGLGISREESLNIRL